jgi:hypothetical protein
VKTIENDEEENFRYVYDELNKSGGVASFVIEDYSGITSGSLIQKKVGQIINDYSMRGSFLTTYSDLIDWRQAISNIEVDLFDQEDESMITIKAKNTSRRVTERIGLIICIPSHYKPYSTSSTDINIDYNSETGYYNILIPFIHPNQTLVFNIYYSR